MTSREPQDQLMNHEAKNKINQNMKSTNTKRPFLIDKQNEVIMSQLKHGELLSHEPNSKIIHNRQKEPHSYFLPKRFNNVRKRINKILTPIAISYGGRHKESPRCRQSSYLITRLT